MMELDIRMCLICVHPPPTMHDGRLTEFGLQDKKQILYPGTLQTDGTFRYEMNIRVKRSSKHNRPQFTGAFVHGTSDAQFLYLSYKDAQDPASSWIKRLKITLSPITWAQIEEAMAKDGALEASVHGSGSASVPLLGDGWVVRAE